MAWKIRFGTNEMYSHNRYPETELLLMSKVGPKASLVAREDRWGHRA